MGSELGKLYWSLQCFGDGLVRLPSFSAICSIQLKIAPIAGVCLAVTCIAHGRSNAVQRLGAADERRRQLLTMAV